MWHLTFPLDEACPERKLALPRTNMYSDIYTEQNVIIPTESHYIWSFASMLVSWFFTCLPFLIGAAEY